MQDKTYNEAKKNLDEDMKKGGVCAPPPPRCAPPSFKNPRPSPIPKWNVNA